MTTIDANQDEKDARGHPNVSGKLKQVEEALANNDIEEAERSIKWLRLRQEIIQVKQARAMKLWALGILLLSVGIISLLISIKIPYVDINASINTLAVSFQLDKHYASDPFGHPVITSHLNMGNVETVSTVPSQIPSPVAHSFDLSVQGTGIELAEIELDSGASIVMEMNGPVKRIYVKGGRMKVVFLVRDGIMILGGDSVAIRSQPEDPPNFINVNTVVSEVKPAYLQIDNSSQLDLNQIPATSLHFLVESPPGSGIFKSSVLSGEINVLQVDQQYNLKAKEYIQLSIKQRKQVGLSFGEEEISATLEAKVDQISAGLEGFVKNLIPSLLAFLYKNNEVILLWSAIVFIAGLLWSIKKLS